MLRRRSETTKWPAAAHTMQTRNMVTHHKAVESLEDEARLRNGATKRATIPVTPFAPLFAGGSAPLDEVPSSLSSRNMQAS